MCELITAFKECATEIESDTVLTTNTGGFKQHGWRRSISTHRIIAILAIKTTQVYSWSSR